MYAVFVMKCKFQNKYYIIRKSPPETMEIRSDIEVLYTKCLF